MARFHDPGVSRKLCDIEYMNRLRHFTPICLSLTGLLMLATARAGIPEDLNAARDAFRAKDAARLEQLANRLDGTLGAPYPRYWQLALDLDNAAPSRVDAYLKQYADSWMSERLRLEWLLSLGRRQQWSVFNQFDAKLGNETQELNCYRLLARQAGGTALPPAELKALWYSGAEQAKGCLTLLDSWRRQSGLDSAAVWDRMRLALREGRITKSDRLDAARATNDWLPAGEQLDLRQLEGIYTSPTSYLARMSEFPKPRAAREVALFALHRQAMLDPAQAAALLQRWQGGMEATDRKYAWGLVAYWASFKLMPEAVEWYRLAGDTALSETQLGWKVRAALRGKDWAMVKEAIAAMPEKMASENTWRYWKARALAAQGNLDEARELYQGLAGEYTYYGLLASEELGQNALNLRESYKPTEGEVKQASQMPGFARGMLLYQMDWKFEANREWLLTQRELDDKLLLAAAEYARRNQWYDRAINTADRTKQLHNFSLRFLSPYRDVMKLHTERLGVNEAWVFGLIRQESRFASVARSAVGAAGLMQLMPGTASWIARRIGLAGYQQSAVHDIDTNVLLGTSYLKYVLDSLGHPVLATAAYNAGPGRARAWLGGKPLEGAIYTESIPFDETRDYVKKVMSNAVFYAAVLGDPYISLKKRMGTMPVRGSVSLAPDAQ